MDAISLASGIQTAKIGAAIDMAVAKKAIDCQKAEGAAVIELIQSAAEAGSPPSQPGVGTRVDEYA